LTEAVDVYAEWVDAIEEQKKKRTDLHKDKQRKAVEADDDDSS